MFEGIVEGVKVLLFALGFGVEPSYRIYYDIDSEACIKYWKKHYGVALESYMALPGCYNRQLYINLDCHYDPWEKSDEIIFGDLMQHYFPDALWAMGKYKLRESKRTKFPHDTIIPLRDEIYIAARCCPPEWMNEILGEGGGPD